MDHRLDSFANSKFGRWVMTGGFVGVLILTLGLYALNVENSLEQKRLESQLENFVQQDSIPSISPSEKKIMYSACGISDTTRYLSKSDLKKGIKYFKSQ